MKTLDRVRSAERELEVEALIKEARERQRRRRRAIALVLLAGAATTLGALAIGGGVGVRGSRWRPVGRPPGNHSEHLTDRFAVLWMSYTCSV
jgi:hypothetical protein